MRRRLTRVALCTAAVAVLGGAVVAARHPAATNSPATQTQASAPSVGGEAQAAPAVTRRPIIARTRLAFEAADRRRLVGVAENVFIGRVVRVATRIPRPATGPGPGIIQTQFEVLVEQSLKGTLPARVIVNQYGGPRSDGLILADGDPLLEPGRAYMLSTGHTEAGWEQIAAPRYGKVPLGGPRRQAALVSAFKAAIARQIPFDIRESRRGARR